VSVSYSSEVLADSPLFALHLDETTGTTLADYSGNSRNFTASSGAGALTLGAAGKMGTAVKGKAGRNDTHAKIAGASWMNVTNWTVEGWFNRSTTSTGRLLAREAGAGQTVANDYIWSMQCNGNSLQVVVFKSGGGGARVITWGTAMAASTWYHIVLTWDGTTLRLYVNGTQVGTDTPGGTLTTSNATDIVLLNAEDTGGTTLSYAGVDISADEVAFYGTALTAARILAHYNAGIALPSIDITTPKATATAAAPAPTMSTSLAYAAPKATAAALALAAALTIGPAPLTLAPPPATSTASAPAPTLVAGPFGFTPPKATATGAAPAPSFAFGAFEVGPPPATATATALPPSINIAGSPLELATPPAHATGDAPPPILTIPLDLPTDDETSDVDLEDDDDDLEFNPPLALPPAGFAERTIWRRSVIVPDLSAYPKHPVTGQPRVPDDEYAQWEADAIVEEVGVPHVLFPDNDDVNDMTYYRGLPIQGLRFLKREPLGDCDADVTIPAMTSMDTHPDDVGAPHPFTRARANMELVMRKSDGSSRRLWSGNVFTRSLGNDGRQPTMTLHALGSLYMADQPRVRPVVSDVPLDCGYLIHRALGLVTAKRYVPPPTVTTGIPSNERGAWSDSPLGFVTGLLAKMWTEDGNQWTIAKIPGTRRAYETRLKKTEPEWIITNGARGVYVDLEEDDNGRNIVFGYGTNPDGGFWQNTKYPDSGGVTRLPLAADPRTQLWLYDDDGNITGANPDFDGNVMPREANVDMGQNTKATGIRAAQQIVDRESVPSFVGRITLETDPREGWRGFINEGDKLTLIGYQGRDLVLHVSDVDVDLANPMLPVTLTVDERSRDAMTVAEIGTRDHEARRDPALHPGNPNRRSRLEVDQIVPFDSESPAGRIPATAVQGGQWNIISVPFATAGRIAKVEFETGSPMAAGLFAYRPSQAHLNGLVGNPLTQDDPWTPHLHTLEDTFGFVAAWGQKGQRMGYSPGREDGGGSFTGKFREATGFDYVAQANARLYLAVYAVADTTVSGRCFPALVV
jgi:hypothetical protein